MAASDEAGRAGPGGVAAGSVAAGALAGPVAAGALAGPVAAGAAAGALTADRCEADPAGVGVVVPPENPTVEPEMSDLLGGSLRCYVARLPLQGADLAQRLAGYVEAMPATVGGFGSLRLAALLVACTGSSYPLGPDGDAALCERLGRSAGAPVATSALAVRSVLEALGRPRVTLLSPYPRWLSDQAARFLADAGVHVRARVELDPEGRGIYRLSAEQVRAAGLAALEATDASAAADGQRHIALFTGTGAPTLAAIEALAARGKLAISSNLCGAWWLVRHAGVDPAGACREGKAPRLPGLHPSLVRLFERTAAS